MKKQWRDKNGNIIQDSNELLFDNGVIMLVRLTQKRLGVYDYQLGKVIPFYESHEKNTVDNAIIWKN